MLYKEDWETSKKRLEALWENEIIDRCCVSIRVPKEGGKIELTEPPENKADLEKWYNDPEWLLDRNIKVFENTYFGGDAFPCIWPNFGTSGHAKYFEQCKYEYTPETVWYAPGIDNWDEDKLVYDPNNERLAREKEILRILAEEGKEKFFVGMPDNCGVMDALANLRGTDSLLMDMMMEPEKIKEAVKEIEKGLIDSTDQLLDIIGDNNEGGSSHAWMQTWLPGKHIQTQCDLSVMISTDMYQEFIRGELENVGKNLDRMIYHFDGQEQIRHLDIILSIKEISMIQWTPVAGQPPTSDFIPVLQRIQKAGKGLVLIPRKWEIEKLMEGLSSKGLQLVINDASSVEEAKDIEKKVAQWTRD